MPRRFAAPALAFAATVLAFLPSLTHGWTGHDDPMFLLGETGWRGLSPGNWAWAFRSGVGGVYQPLAWLTYGLDWLVWGLDPRGYHLQNVLWHAAAAALFCLAAREILEAARPGRARELDAAALFAALLFAVHPLRAESVSWASERRDVVCGAFAAATVLAHLRRARGWTLAFLLLSLLAKGMTVLLPAALLALDFYPLRRIGPRGEGLREAAREKLPLFAAAAAFIAAGAAVQERIRWTLEQHGLLARLAQACYALAFYVRKTLWPADLSPLYELRAPLDVLEPRFVLSAAAVAAALWACWRERRARPWLAASAWWYGVLLLPVSGLAQFGPQLVADRYSYMTAWPLALLAGAGLRGALARRPLAAGAGALILLASLAAAGVRQQAVWAGSEPLWERVLAVDPGSAAGRLSRGVLRAAQGRLAEAEDDFRASLAVYPECEAQQDRLAALLAEGARSEERERLARAVEGRPSCRRARANLGAIRAQRGDLKGAVAILRVAAAIDPRDAGALLNLARAERELAGRQPR